MFKYKIRLDTRPSEETNNGFPVAAFLSLNGKRKRISLQLYFNLSDWDLKIQLPKNNKRASLLIKKKILFLDQIGLDVSDGKIITLDFIKSGFLGNAISDNKDFFVFFNLIISEKKLAGKIGTADIYETAKNQLLVYRQKLSFSEIDYNLLSGFKSWKLAAGNKKNTVHTYLRKFKFIYNEAVRRGVVADTKPFVGVFKGIAVKSNRTKKRYVNKEVIYFLESLTDLAAADQRAVHLWLLMFYFGGQSLKDLYFTRNKNVANGRIFINRLKLDDLGYEFDLKIVVKAQRIIDLYKTSGEYLFGNWRKDEVGYKTFRSGFRRSLLKIQQKYNLQVLPKGGNITISVARHTFGTHGKFLFIETDLLRELMGHERSDVDTIYKAKYPQDIRDAAHLKIIN
jgi:hypothetical protein